MYAVIAGAALGIAVGALNHLLLRHALTAGQSRAADGIGGMAAAFRLRYAALALVLLLFWFSTRSGAGETVLALTAVVSSRLLLLRTFRSGGDRP